MTFSSSAAMRSVHAADAAAPSLGVAVGRRVRPRPAAELSRLTRYHGGTYSHTVDRIVFADGAVARTDLIRLNPGVSAYSLDFSGIAPLRPSRYDVESFAELPNTRARAFEAEIDWILRNSFPTLRTTDLSARMRAAGYPLGVAHISEHEAIAATQAAIWHFTNGLDLDTRPRNEPEEIVRDRRGVTVRFAEELELDGYQVELAAAGPVTVRLHKSADGRAWQEVAASALVTGAAGAGVHSKALGMGATVSHGHGHTRRGHRHYRITVDAVTALGDVWFSLAGSGAYRNAPRVVHAYRYLLDGAYRARAAATAPDIDAAGARADGPLIGPLRLRASSAAALIAGGAQIVDADGAAIDDAVEPGEAFYLRPRVGTRAATLTMTVPGRRDGSGGQVLTGVARDEASQRLTPVALVVPTETVVEFDLSW